MSEVVYRSRVQIERIRGTFRLALLPACEEPVAFGVHHEIAEHYCIARGDEEERTTTIDYLVAAAAG